MSSKITDRIEYKIIDGLIHDEEYARKVIPFIRSEYFRVKSERIIFEEIVKFFNQYNHSPTLDILSIEIEGRSDLSESDFDSIDEIINDYIKGNNINADWLLDETEKWCKSKAVYIALTESIRIYDGKHNKLSVDAIPGILSDALSVGFDNNIGHDYTENYLDRFQEYHKLETKIPFDIELLNKITKGGLSPKTLNVILAGTGTGKTLFMCHLASSFLLGGKNVLYITMEMSEAKISERIDANLMNLNISDIPNLTESSFESKMKSILSKTSGKLIVKEYPTASAHAGHFKALLNELRLKKSFFPDVIFVDYLNICSSSRYKGGNVNSYTLVKSIAEELRGLAVEYKVPLVSATQTTRTGYNSDDVELTDTSESFGLPATADLMLALISTEELEELGQLMVKQLKNRYNDMTYYRKFVIGVDRAKMKLFDVNKITPGIQKTIPAPTTSATLTKRSFEGFIV